MKELGTDGKESGRLNKTASTGNYFFQPKLTIGSSQDHYEQEADRVAEEVVHQKDVAHPVQFKKISPIVQPKCAHCEEEELVQRKENPGEEVEAPAIVGDALGSDGTPLDDTTQSFMSARFGYDFSNVKVHTGTVATKSADAINALAYTSGNDIVFNEGQYSPETDNGKKLLAHELTHVVQQDTLQTKKIQRKKSPYEASDCGKEFTFAFDGVIKSAEGAEVAYQTGGIPITKPEEGKPATEPGGKVVKLYNGEEVRIGPVGYKYWRAVCLQVPGRVAPEIFWIRSQSVTEKKTEKKEEEKKIDTKPSHIPGKSVNKIGFVKWSDESNPLKLRSEPNAGADQIGTLPFNTRLMVMEETPDLHAFATGEFVPDWYYVSTADGQVGYAAKAGKTSTYITTDLPEPNAFLHKVESGKPGFAISIAERYFSKSSNDWGKDLRFYVAVIAFVNNLKIPDETDGWKDVQFNSGDIIWIPSTDFADSLKGKVNSGSYSYNLADSVGLTKLLEPVWRKITDYKNAIALSQDYVGEAIKKHAVESIINALISLGLFLLAAGALLAITTALGAAIGALAGGVGAAPGAAIGFEVGSLLLEWIGLGMLIKWIADTLVKVGDAFGTALSTIWNANGNRDEVDKGAHQLADAVGILIGEIIGFLLTLAIAKGLGKAAESFKNTKFMEMVGEAKFKTWLSEKIASKEVPAKIPGDTPAEPPKNKTTESPSEKPTEKAKVAESPIEAEGKSADGKRKLQVDQDGVCKVCASPCLRILEKYGKEIKLLSDAFSRDIPGELTKIEGNKKIPSTQKLTMYEFLEQELANFREPGKSIGDMSSHVKNVFAELAKFRESLTLPEARTESGNPTMSNLEIGGENVKGVNYNKVGTTPSRSKADIDLMQALVKEVYKTTATTAAMEHAEADAVLSAFDQGLTSEKANLYVDKPLCNFCRTSLRRLFPLLNLKALTVFELNSGTGQITSYTIFSAEL